MFLVKIAREGIRKGTEGKTFFDFVVLFVEASLLIAMGLTLNSFHAFTGWITLLIIIDASWLFISLAKKDYSAPIGVVAIGYSVYTLFGLDSKLLYIRTSVFYLIDTISNFCP